jgi:hypothetical protein
MLPKFFDPPARRLFAPDTMIERSCGIAKAATASPSMTDDQWNEFETHVSERLANETAFSLDDTSWRNAFTFPRPHFDLLVATSRRMNAPFSLESDFQAELGEAMVFTCRRLKYVG